MQLGRGAAFGGAALGRAADQVFHADVELIGERGQCAREQAQTAGFVVREGLLSDAELFGELQRIVMNCSSVKRCFMDSPCLTQGRELTIEVAT